MIVHSGPDGLSLREPDDFRNFKVVVTGDAAPAASTLTFVDAGNALVAKELVPDLPGAPDTDAWREGYEKMVAAAAKYGWIDEASGAIKAHVEYE